MEIREPNWEARAGRVTASRASDLMARGRNGQKLTGYDNLIATLAVEIVTGTSYSGPGFQSAAMLRGQELEGEARQIFEAGLFVDVDVPDHIPCGNYLGATPDGLFEREGERFLLELKVISAPAKMARYIRDPSTLANEYYWQLVCQLACVPDAAGAYIAAYCPEFIEVVPGGMVEHYLSREAVADDINELHLAAKLAREEAETLAEELAAIGATYEHPVPEKA